MPIFFNIFFSGGRGVSIMISFICINVINRSFISNRTIHWNICSTYIRPSTIVCINMYFNNFLLSLLPFFSAVLSFSTLSSFPSPPLPLPPVQNELEMAKSSVWAGAGGRVTSDLVETLSFLLNTKPYVISGKERHWVAMLCIRISKGLHQHWMDWTLPTRINWFP